MVVSMQQPGLFEAYSVCCNAPAMDLADRIITAREGAGLTQDQLAKASGVSQQTINKLETRKASSTSHIVEIAVACGVSPYWLALELGEREDYVFAGDAPRGVSQDSRRDAEIMDAALTWLHDLASLSGDPRIQRFNWRQIQLARKIVGRYLSGKETDVMALMQELANAIRNGDPADDRPS